MSDFPPPGGIRRTYSSSALSQLPNTVESSSKTFAAVTDEQRRGYISAADIFQTSKGIPVIYEEIKQNINERQSVQLNEPRLSLTGDPSVLAKQRVELESIALRVEESPSVEHHEKAPITAPSPSVKGPDATGKKPANAAKADYDADEHTLSLEELAHRVETNIDLVNPGKSKGLSSEAAAEKLRIHGPNKLLPPKETPEIIKFLMHFLNMFMLLLEAAGILCFIAYSLDRTQPINLYLGIVLWGIVIMTCIVSYVQGRQSSNIMNSFKNMLPQKCRVIRDGTETRVEVETLVVGDMVVVNAGDKIPGDIRVIACDGLKVDNSSLTGESDPQACSTVCTDSNPLETHNLAFYGTLCMDGSAKGIIIRTGPRTLIGRIASLASETSGGETTLQKEIKRFVRFISILGICMGIIFFIIGLATHVPIITNMINVLGIIVANVPEGLPSTVTACLTVTARRLAKKNVYVKQLECVETLGSITLIASDKTGTLTQNRMTVAHLWYDNEIVKAVDAGTLGRKALDPKDPTCKHLLRLGAVCNRAQFDQLSPGNMEKPIDSRIVLGDASESALVRLCHKLEPIEQSRANFLKIFEIPFNSTNKWQLSIHRQEYADGAWPAEAAYDRNQRILLMKGAPEVILAKCSHILIRGERIPLDAKWTANFTQAYEAMGGMGERVLGFGEMYLDYNEFNEKHDEGFYDVQKMNFPTHGLTFVGLMSLLDPPRETVPFAVSQCKSAGIKVMMVTGDHPITAKAIARKVGIISGLTREDVALRDGIKPEQVDESLVDAVVTHGSMIPALSEEQWDVILSKKQIVFARTSPQQKSIIVEHCQARGEVVAVTGDGVNDSPALKKADIGVAMGIVGSDVAKEAADVILLDDNFASIVAAVEEGRIIFDNLKKSIAYTLSHLLPELAPFLFNLFIGIPIALSSVLILCIDLGTELAPAIMLAYEQGEADVMQRKPRDQNKDHLVNGRVISYSYLQAGIIETLACFFAFFVVMGNNGFPPQSLVNTRNYFSPGCDPLVVNGRSYSADEQVQALHEAQSAYFISVVLVQIINILVSKTRFVSLFKHGVRNMRLNIAIVIEVTICVLIVYIPPLHIAFQSAFVHGIFWLPALPFCLLLLAWNELRKKIARDHPNSPTAMSIAY